MRIKRLFILLFLAGAGSLAQGQGLRYSQSYVLGSNINPSFTGLGNSYKFGLLHRNQWSKLPSNLLSTGLNFEMSNTQGDLAGGLVLNQSKSTQALVQNEVGLTARKSIFFGKNSQFNFGASVLYGSFAVDTDQLVFGDQLNIDGSIADVSLENVAGISSNSYLDIMSGMSVRLNDLLVGVSGKYLNRPNTSLMGDVYNQPLYLHFVTSYNIHTILTNLPFTGPNEIFEISIRPFLTYETQNGLSSIDFGAYVNFDPILLGLKYRGLALGNENEYNVKNKDALSIMLGYELKKVSLTYSYDVIFTNIQNSGGTHELGFIFRKPSGDHSQAVYF